jgi:cytochrome c
VINPVTNSATNPVIYPVRQMIRLFSARLLTGSLLAGCLLVATAGLAGVARADDASDPGTLQFKKSCGTCHTTDAKAAPRQGPNLHKVVGRQAGTMKGFKYSAAFMKAAPGITWTPDIIDKWITDPQQVIPGAVMLYHQSDPDKRKLIVDYLKTQ